MIIEGEQTLNDSIIPALQPVLQKAHSLMGWTEYFLGGLFGLYLLFFIIRTIMDHNKNKNLKEIKEQVKQINERLSKKR